MDTDPTPADLDLAARRVRESLGPLASEGRSPWASCEDDILAVFDLFAQAPSSPVCRPLLPVAYRGLLGALAPPDACATGVALAVQGPGRAPVVGVLVLCRSGRLWASAAPSEEVGLGDLAPFPAALAALLHRRLGIACPFPPDAGAAGVWASEWGGAIHKAAAMKGAPLGPEEAMALDPLLDPGSSPSSGRGPLEMWADLAEGRSDFVLDPHHPPLRPLLLGDHRDWLDLGSFAWVLRARAAGLVDLAVGLRRCLEPEAYDAVAAALVERGWAPEPADPLSALLAGALEDAGLGPLGLPPLQPPPLPPCLEDPALAGALATFCERLSSWEAPPPPPPAPGPLDRMAPGLGVVAGFAWSATPDPLPPHQYPPLRSGPSRPGRPPAGGPLAVAQDDELLLDRAKAFSGLLDWDPPASCDGLAIVCVAEDAAHYAAQAARHAFWDLPAWRSEPRPLLPDPDPWETVVVAVDRQGQVGWGRVAAEPDPPGEPRPLLVWRAEGLGDIAGQRFARFVAAWALGALGRQAPPPPPPASWLRAWLASLWVLRIAEEAASSPRPLGLEEAAALEPAHPSMAAIRRLAPEEAPALVQAMAPAVGADLEPLPLLAACLGPRLFGWAAAALAPPAAVLRALVEASCEAGAAAWVTGRMATSGAFEIAWPQTASRGLARPQGWT